MRKDMERIKVNLKRPKDDSYEILIGHGILDRLAQTVEGLHGADGQFIVTDSNVNPLYGEMVTAKLAEEGLPVHVIEIPAGEASKSMETVLAVAGKLLELKAGRKSRLFALGGGVVGDLTGFVASIYMRSVPYVQIATSLVAQVDSSVGGKTAVDLDQGKNLLGTFYQPEAVFIDPSFLKTLSDRDIKNGLAEIIKYAIIRDGEMFHLLEERKDAVFGHDPLFMEKLVFRSCRIKARIVEKDEKEGGLRRILNLGHTLGHALEAASDYSISHGEAVAMGTVAASKISLKLGYLDKGTDQRIAHVLEQYGLPVRIPAGFNPKEIFGFMAIDKKVVGKRIHFVLIEEIGAPFVTDQVPREIVEEVIKELTS
jgi:3-dehydroquinate synthase